MTKRLYRSRDERMLAGVCGGIAEYLDADPTIVRVAFVVATLFTWPMAILLYLALAFIMPERPEEPEAPAQASSPAETRGAPVSEAPATSPEPEMPSEEA
ncbi:MAG TPA: PspC domain-containing protein [Dehalococcoidia bacterium]|nr:PspC domain-containing protein [Dehalococcoidia bacterium]